MIVAATTECFPDLPLMDAIGRLTDLEYSSVEISIKESGIQVKPSQVAQDVEKAAALCRDTHRMNIVGYNVEIGATGDEFYEHFHACCRLAKATKVFTLTVPSAELGTPFNEEVERLREMVRLATIEGARVAIKSQIGRLSEDPDTVVVLCDNVKGLGLTLDPTHYLCGPHAGRDCERIMKYVIHVRLRDSSKDELQVRIGQGEIEYGRLVTQLRKSGYDRALSVDLVEQEGLEHAAEMRKMRLLLESLV